MNLTDTLQHWRQGQINASINGVLARLDRLEQGHSNADAVIRGQGRMIEQLAAEIDALREEVGANRTRDDAGYAELHHRVMALEQMTPDEQRERVADRVRCIVADYIDNDDQLMTRHMFYEALDAFFNESSFKIKLR